MAKKETKKGTGNQRLAKLEVLKKSDLFSKLDDEQLKRIAEMCYPEVFEVGASLVKQGRKQEKVYLIEDGLVGIYLEEGPMTSRQIQTASNLEVIGWSAMLPPRRSTASAKAIETTKVLAFDSKDLLNLCSTYPEIGNKIYRELAAIIAIRLSYAFNQLMGCSISLT